MINPSKLAEYIEFTESEVQVNSEATGPKLKHMNH